MCHAGHALGQRASYWVAALVVVQTLWASAAPVMSYPLYASQWGLTHTVTTAIFAVYPITVVAVLILFGDICDYIGRRTAMLAGIAASMLAAMFFAIVPRLSWLLFGRALMGIGVGFSASPAAIALVEFSPVG